MSVTLNNLIIFELHLISTVIRAESLLKRFIGGC